MSRTRGTNPTVIPAKTGTQRSAELSDSLLSHIATASGRDVSPATYDKFREYYRLLLRWNDRAGLTTITDPAEVVDKHFCDAALAVRMLAAPHPLPRPSWARSIDVGSGGGFPGIVLRLLLPELGPITLVEATAKKVSFLRTVIRELGLTNIEAVQGRVESPPSRLADSPPSPARGGLSDPKALPPHGGKGWDRGGFAVAVSRATFAPADWLALGATLVAPGGHVLAFAADAPLPESSPGLTRVMLSKTQLPISGAPRTLGLYRRDG